MVFGVVAQLPLHARATDSCSVNGSLIRAEAASSTHFPNPFRKIYAGARFWAAENAAYYLCNDICKCMILHRFYVDERQTRDSIYAVHSIFIYNLYFRRKQAYFDT